MDVNIIFCLIILYVLYRIVDNIISRLCSTCGSQYSGYKQIGSGAFGKVYKARGRNGEFVAIKILDNITTIRSEIDILKLLKNQYIIGFKGYGNDRIIMEYFEGQTLTKYLAKKGKIEGEQLLEILRQILEGITYLHSMDVIHRDIKPDNIMIKINKAGVQIKLIDMGLSDKLNKTMSVRKLAMGTPFYSAPELIDGEINYSYKIDIWAFGIIAIQLITGHVPNEGGQLITVIRNIMNNESPHLPYNGNYHPSLHKFIAASLEKKPDRRASGKQLLKLLKKVVLQ